MTWYFCLETSTIALLFLMTKSVLLARDKTGSIWSNMMKWYNRLRNMELHTKIRYQMIKLNCNTSSIETSLKARLNLPLPTSTTRGHNNMIRARKLGYRLGVTEYYGKYLAMKTHKLNRKWYSVLKSALFQITDQWLLTLTSFQRELMQNKHQNSRKNTLKPCVLNHFMPLVNRNQANLAMVNNKIT
jgi:hypothetical protein